MHGFDQQRRHRGRTHPQRQDERDRRRRGDPVAGRGQPGRKHEQPYRHRYGADAADAVQPANGPSDGHRRKHACELAGLATMPVIVRDIDRDAATIIMVDSNLQRENILPSERAKAYKMKMEAIKRQGARTDLTSPKISAKFRSDDARSLSTSSNTR